MLDATRDIRQNSAIDKVIHNIANGGIGGCLSHPTGFGKSTEAFKFIKRFNKDKLVHLVVPTIELKTQWEEKLFEVPNKVEVYVVNSYVSVPRVCDLIISDEGHRYANESAKVFNKVLTNCKFTYALILSATYTKDQLKFLLNLNLPLLDIISVDEAKARKWIAKSSNYNLGLDLTDEELKNYTRASNIMKAHAPYLEGLDPFTALFNKDALKQHCIDNGLDYSEMGMRITRYNTAVQNRKFTLYGAKAKLDIIPSIVDLLGGKQAVLFSETKKFAEQVHKLIPNSVLYHSTLSADKKKKALDLTKDGTAKLLCTAKALDEGLDIPNLKIGITASGTSTIRQSKQREGRIGRYTGEDATMITLYMKNTVEVGWVVKRQKETNGIEWINSINEIII